MKKEGLRSIPGQNQAGLDISGAQNLATESIQGLAVRSGPGMGSAAGKDPGQIHASRPGKPGFLEILRKMCGRFEVKSAIGAD